MISLFRRIRQKLIDSGSFTKYMLYAIGEILLVVIGILIALQVNNWNEERNELDAAQVLLYEIKKNLIQTSVKFWEENLFMRDARRSTNILIDHLEREGAYHDSLNNHFSRINNYYLANPNLGAYEALKNRGFDIIPNPDLTSLLTIYFEVEITWLIKVEEYYMEDIRSLLSFTKDHFQIKKRDPEASEFLILPVRHPRDYSKLRQNTDFLNNLIYSTQMLDGLIATREILRDKAKYALGKIDQELLKLSGITSQDSTKVHFQLEGYPDSERVFLTGPFSYWMQDGIQMQHDIDNNLWYTTISLPSGTMQTYKFIVDDVWILDPANPNTQEDEQGLINSVIQVE